ncbi:FUSC family protein [Utexia brackfieldae]|uniref:FUSC family protein n=1 Tax=Utexia brackfieldae TaxID=3074108 RepID=UPI00370DA38E
MSFHLKESTKTDLIMALYCLPGIILIYIIGLNYLGLLPTSIAASGAVTVGYGANKKLVDLPFAPMFIAIIGMSITTFLGSVLGHYYLALVIVGMLMGALCSLVGLVDASAWWIIVQWAIGFFVAGYYADSFSVATQRASLILLGGLFQAVCIMLLLQKTNFERNTIKLHDIRCMMLRIHHDFDKKIRFNAASIYGALAILLCFGLTHIFYIPYNYWAAITVLVILKPDFKNTLLRTSQRLLGTFLGIVLATALSIATSSNVIIVIEIILSLYLCYALFNHAYAVLTTFMTLSVVLMFSISGVPETQLALDRILATLIGGISALVTMTLRSLYLRLLSAKGKRSQ